MTGLLNYLIGVLFKSSLTENIKRLKMLTDLPCLNDRMWTPSLGVILGWVLCMAHLIFCPPIIACGGQHSPLHGHGCSLCATKGS